MKKLYTTAILLMLLGLSFSLYAQDSEEPTLSVSGSIDAYFRANLNTSNDPTSGETIAPGTSFANLPGFSLGMANIVGSYEGEKVGAVADLVFGPRGVDAVFASAAPLNIVNQLYVYWNVSDNVTLTMGNFNTFLGYEVISPSSNFNYSTSYMFSYGPFSHSGLKADISFGEGFSFMGAILNPTDATDFNPSGDYLGGAQLGYSNDAGGAWLNALFDDEFFQIDLTTGWDVSDALYLGLNATSASDNFVGGAIYAQVATSDALGLGIRGEYFQDKGLGLFAEDESVIDVTLSANYTVGSLTIIPEFRIDSFSQDIVVTGTELDTTTDVLVATDVAGSLSSFVLAAVYTF
ncbi:MAG: porin [bacterium]|nr:porin [bacterium]